MEANSSNLTTARPSSSRGRWDEITIHPVWDWQAGLKMLSQASADVYCVQTPGTPLIAIQRRGSRLEIAWEGSEEFVLEMASGIKPSDHWKTVPQRPKRWANFNLVTLEPGLGDRFFRLRRMDG
jgi:hypothetical protein